MFNNLRRPVPSKAALKVLYQLAYISSGTAVGIATLCTEERRRRAKIVQKIADNARRIRQSPRYVHNAAAARSDELESPRQDLLQDWPWVQLDTVHELVDRERKRRPVRDSDLPSAVDRGYEQVAWRDYKRTRRRRTSARGNDAGAKSDRHRSDNLHTLSQTVPSTSVVRRVDMPKQLINVYEMRKMRDNGRQLRLLKQVEEEFELRMPACFQDVMKDVPGESPFEKPILRSRTPQSTSRDIKLFFQKQPWSSNGRTEKGVASNLLLDAIAWGTFEEIRSLYRWLFARDAVRTDHLVALCNACPELAERSNHQDLFDFYIQLFESDEFRGHATKERIRHCLIVAEETASWRLALTFSTRFDRLLKTLGGAHLTEVLDVVEEFVDKLLDSKNAPRASRFITKVTLSIFRGRPGKSGSRATFGKDNGEESERRLRKVQEKVFASALEHGQISTASRHIEHVLRQLHSDRIRKKKGLSYLETLSLACIQHNSYTSLSRFLSHEDPRCRLDHLTPYLSDLAKTAVAKACILDRKRLFPKSLFDEIYSTLPARHRDSLAEARTSRLLQDQWRTTQDFPATWTAYLSARDFAVMSGTQELRNATDATMIDICNAANRPDQALELLSDLNQRAPQSSRILSMAAMSLAQKKAWVRMRKLMELMGTAGDFTQDGVVSRCFDNIIRHFAHWHSPADTWRFVTNLVENLRFVPTWATSQIVLRAFVRKKHLSFVSHWLRYLKTIGVRFEMDVRTAANLMDAYYLDQRPPHVLVMWFCRQITQLVPSFDAAAFERVMTEAIGYDLRKGKADTREKAEEDLALLQRSKGIIPKCVNAFRDPSSDEPVLTAETLESEHRQVDHPPSQQNSVETLSREECAQISYHGLVRDITNDDATPDTLAAIHFYTGGQADGTGVSPALQHVGNETIKGDSDVSLYVADLGAERQSKHEYETREQQVQREMITAISQQNYDQVLETYFSSLSPTGLPISPKALEIAVDASLRLRRGDRTEAESLMGQAGKAGMNVSRAMQPLLLNHMWHLNADDKRDADKLRSMVMEWYRTNEANGLPVNNHIGITAANILINNHRPEYGINLLTDLGHSERIERQPFDIVAMTVYLKGYAALRSAKGIKWAIATVLRNNMRIDRKFVDTIKECVKHFEVSGVSQTGKPNERPNHLRVRLRRWRLVCAQRRMQQRHDTKVFGRNLVKFISKLANDSDRPMIDADIRKELDSQLFGATSFSAVAPATNSPQIRQPLRRARARIAHDIRWDQGPRHEGRRTADITRDVVWLKQYRAFLRRDIVMPDGKLASFRYRLANVPRQKYRRKPGTRPVQTAPMDESRDDEQVGQSGRLEIPSEETSARYEPYS